MDFSKILSESLYYLSKIDPYEAMGLAFGLLAVWWLIKENILTWPVGILYTLVSFVIFWRAKLYADLLLNFVYLILNSYGWYYWKYGNKTEEKDLPVTATTPVLSVVLLILSIIGVGLMGLFFSTYTDAALPYWDSITTVLSFTGMWLTAKKKIENWYYWFVVDIVATGVYYYKEIYFYSILYCIYVGLAVAGYVSWRRSMLNESYA